MFRFRSAPTQYIERMITLAVAAGLLVLSGYTSLLADQQTRTAADFAAAPGCTAAPHGDCVTRTDGSLMGTQVNGSATTFLVHTGAAADIGVAAVSTALTRQVAPGMHIVMVSWTGSVRRLETPLGSVATLDDPAEAAHSWQSATAITFVLSLLVLVAGFLVQIHSGLLALADGLRRLRTRRRHHREATFG